jgi:hypothetical protein
MGIEGFLRVEMRRSRQPARTIVETLRGHGASEAAGLLRPHYDSGAFQQVEPDLAY